MKLYELIELGSVLIGESHHTYFYRDRKGNCVGCALTAAYAAIHQLPERELMAGEMYAWLGPCVDAPALAVPCPVCMSSRWRLPLLAVVDHLHGFHFWSRQRIAEWLKPIEDKWEAEHADPVAAEATEAGVHA